MIKSNDFIHLGKYVVWFDSNRLNDKHDLNRCFPTEKNWKMK